MRRPPAGAAGFGAASLLRMRVTMGCVIRGKSLIVPFPKNPPLDGAGSGQRAIVAGYALLAAGFFAAGFLAGFSAGAASAFSASGTAAASALLGAGFFAGFSAASAFAALAAAAFFAAAFFAGLSP